MNLSSLAAAGRSRSADADAFLRPNVVHTTGSDPSARPLASAYAWKRVLQERIWSTHGPKGMAARSVLMLLIWHADASGRAWLGIPTIATKSGAGSLRTVRNALDALVRDGWLQSTPQTWATLTAEQAAAGRPAPRRGDVGQAPNLYVVLDGRGKPITPGQNGPGGPGQNAQGEALADLLCDLDPKGSRSRIERAERGARVDPTTHRFSKIRDESHAWLKTWNVIVEAHADKTKTIYGLPPLPPDVKPEQQKALAECLDGAAVDVRAKIRERTGIERDVNNVQRDLATRVMQLYFKRDVEHLRRVKHALRDLPREFHARITEAMQLLLRESHDATLPPRVKGPDKPVEVVKLRPIEAVQALPSAQVSTAREARRLLEALNTTPPHEERTTVETSPQTTKRPRLDDVASDVAKNVTTEADTTRERLDKPGPDEPIPDKPATGVHAMARVGAPRWGAVGPRLTKVRNVSKVWPEPCEERDESGARLLPKVPLRATACSVFDEFSRETIGRCKR